MPDDSVLDGVRMTPADMRAALAQRGQTTRAKWQDWCKACSSNIQVGQPLVCCLKFGWAHEACVDKARAALEAGDG